MCDRISAGARLVFSFSPSSASHRSDGELKLLVVDPRALLVVTGSAQCTLDNRLLGRHCRHPEPFRTCLSYLALGALSRDWIS